MCVKIDRAKDYHSVKWDYLEEALLGMRFPPHFIKIIMVCVFDAHISVLVNGNSEGYLKATRGLRQGCPLSPFLFAIVMEYFSIMMTKYASSQLIPTPFQKTQVTLFHLMFADDLFMFCKA